jgi:hypothetical protein
MLGYHDLDAFKELRRRLDAGKLKISRPAEHEKNRESNGANSKRRGPDRTQFASVPGQPTMIAEMASMGPNKWKVTVRVTQGGVPVSPPSSPGMPFYSSSEMPPSVEELRENRKEPLPLLLSLPSIGEVSDLGATNRQSCGVVNMDKKAESSNGNHAVIRKHNHAPIANAANDSRTPDLSVSSVSAHQLEHQSDFQFVPFLTDDGSHLSDNKWETSAMGGYETDSGGDVYVSIHDGENHIGKVDGTKPQLALDSSTPETASALLVSKDEMQNAKNVQCMEAIASPSTAIKINI